MEKRVTSIGHVKNDFSGARVNLSCGFCLNTIALSDQTHSVCEFFRRNDKFYCPFCIRNKFDQKNNRHVLILTFRSVFGYFYYAYYRTKKRSMFLAEIQDYIRDHVQAGLTNPLFHYDPQSYLWFVDFERVGDTGRRIPVVEIKKTILNILMCFNLHETIPQLRLNRFYDKYREAVDDWHSKRYRPAGRPICIPTFTFCGITETKELPFDKTREFLPKDMIPFEKS